MSWTSSLDRIAFLVQGAGPFVRFTFSLARAPSCVSNATVWVLLALLIILKIIEGVGLTEDVGGFIIGGPHGGTLCKINLAGVIFLEDFQVIEASRQTIKDNGRRIAETEVLSYMVVLCDIPDLSKLLSVLGNSDL